MRSTYRALAYIIAAEVVIQAAVITYAMFGLSQWVDAGGTLNKSVWDDPNASFTGAAGFAIHGINGEMVVPLLALVLLVVSFFAKVSGGPKWAGTILALVVIQVLLGLLAHAAPLLGPLHGINALILFSVAVMAGRRVSSAENRDASVAQQVTA
jgi:hypothetical protein